MRFRKGNPQSVYHEIIIRTIRRGSVSGRILAIDFGLKRIGLAISDALGITAQGLPTRERTRLEDDLSYIRGLAQEHSVSLVIVGNPIGNKGGATSMSRQVAAFAERLKRHLSCPVSAWDERLTTSEAMRVLRASGIGIEKRRLARDRVAAALLLQSYLDFHANERARDSLAEAEQP